MLAPLLDLNQGWGIGEETFQRIVEAMRSDQTSYIVEFGSGVSSIRLALALPQARILSIEGRRDFYDAVMELRSKHHVQKTLAVDLRPLQWQIHGGAAFLSYAPGPFPDRIDSVLIDGPPTWTRRGREACLYQIASRLRIGGKIFLDDFDRRREKKIVRNWMLSYPDCFRFLSIETGHGVCVLEKLREVPRPRTSMRALPDHVLQVVSVLVSHPLKRE